MRAALPISQEIGSAERALCCCGSCHLVKIHSNASPDNEVWNVLDFAQPQPAHHVHHDADLHPKGKQLSTHHNRRVLAVLSAAEVVHTQETSVMHTNNKDTVSHSRGKSKGADIETFARVMCELCRRQTDQPLYAGALCQ
jgi:hypothetical protein